MNRTVAALCLVSLALPRGVHELPTARGTEPELRVTARTAYLAPDPDGAQFRRDRDVVPFEKPGTSLLWFGEFTSTGTLSAAVELTVPRGESVPLRLTVSSEPRDGAWERAPAVTHDAVAVGTDGSIRVDFGAFEVETHGYMRFALSAPGRRGAPGVKVAALLLGGAPLTAAHFNPGPRRNAASVHLRYPVDSTAVITGFYNEVAAVEDPVPTYYMATGFARGYFGMQVNSPTERRIIFSVWDSGEGGSANDRSTVAAEDQTQLVAKGEGVVAEVFGNEGTGGHSHLVYDWKTGSRQRFYVTAVIDGTHTIYTGYWFHPERQRWQLIASFRAPKDGQGLRRLYSFSEDFGGSTGHQMRRALFGPQWIRLADGKWQELTRATFSHDATGKADRSDRFMGTEGDRFFLQHGGFVSGFTASGTAFTRPASGVPPRIQLPNDRD